LFAGSLHADQTISDDLITKGSLCVGVDCSTGENFSFDTIRLKENNLRIKFQDTSASSSFPTTDWQITINDSSNGGQSYFAVEDITNGTRPFYINESAPTNAFFMDNRGRIGVGTSAPIRDIHVLSGNTPAIRLDQDTSNGWSAQIWEIIGNETNFAVRDFTNKKLPLKIRGGAPNNSLFIDSNGDIGLKTSTPDGIFDIADPADANDHALLVDPTGNIGINIDNGQVPAGRLDIQTTGGVSLFRVEDDGKVMFSNSWEVQGVNSGGFTIQSIANASTKITLGADGSVVIGGVDAATKIELNTDGSIVIGNGITVDNTGNVTVTNLTVTGACTGC
jgi:hypothetical protein